MCHNIPHEMMLRSSSLLRTSSRGVTRSLSTVGTLYSRGVGLFGALGIDDSLQDVATYTPIPALQQLPIVKVSAGWGHSAALSEDGKLLLWGKCYDFPALFRLNNLYAISSRLGRFASRAPSQLLRGEEVLFNPTPVIISALPEIVDVRCSGGLTVLLGKAGQVFACGFNRWMQCGTDSKGTHYVYDPLIVPIPRAMGIDAGMQHGLAVTVDGEVFSWGKSTRGQLGIGQVDGHCRSVQRVPIKSESGKDLPCVAVSAGLTHSAALTEDGSVFVWGKQMSTNPFVKNRNETFKMYDDQFVPRKLKLPNRAVEICSSGAALVIRTEDHRLWAVGLCEEDRNFMCEPIPVTLDVPGKTENSVEVVPFFLSEQGIMRKGHLRVLVHSPGTAGFKEDRDLFEVVLHQEQAYCLPWRGLQQLPEEMQTGAIDVLDFSAGWKHDLLLVKKPPAPASAPVSSHEM